MKAITPVIALVMLLLITVGIVGASYTWFGGLMSSQTKKSITIPPGGAYCADGDIKVYVLNNGDTTITASDIVVAQVDGVDVKGTPFFGDMRSGLVGYWKFDEAGGTTATDSSGVVPPNTGTLNGNPQRVVGKSRNALAFDGADDYVNAGNAASLRPAKITVAAWVRVASVPAEIDFVSKYGIETAWTFFIVNAANQKIRFLVYNSLASAYATADSVVQIGRWYHVVGTYDGSNVRVYVDGVLQAGQGTLTGDIRLSPNTNVNIGRTTSGSYYFDGTIDEVKIYNKAAGDVNIQPGKSGLIVSYPGVEGKHIVRIATSSNAAEASVAC